MANDDAGGMSLDSMQSGVLELNAIDQLIIGKALEGSDVLELCSPKIGLVPGMSLDPTNGYDFDEKKDQDKAWEFIRWTKPTLVVGSPPCTDLLFSSRVESCSAWSEPCMDGSIRGGGP